MRVILAFAACVLIWGTTWYAIEWQLGHVPKEWSLTYRYFIAAAVIVAWCFYKKLPMRYTRRQHLFMLGAGLFLFSGNYLLVYWGTEYLTSALVAITFSLLTLFNIVNARLFLGVDIQANTVFSAFLGVVGLILIFKPEIQAFNSTDDTTLGLVICIGATLVASWGNTVIATKAVSKLPLLPFNAWAMVYGALLNLAFAIVQGTPPSLDPRPEYYISLLYLSVAGTVVAFSLYLWLLSEIGVARASYTAVMTPLVALLVSTLFEGYLWSVYAAIGVGFVLLGNLLMSLRKLEVGTKN